MYIFGPKQIGWSYAGMFLICLKRKLYEGTLEAMNNFGMFWVSLFVAPATTEYPGSSLNKTLTSLDHSNAPALCVGLVMKKFRLVLNSSLFTVFQVNVSSYSVGSAWSSAIL